MGPSQAPFSDEEEKSDDVDVQYLDILVQGDGRDFGAHCSNVRMSFAILNEGRAVARPGKHYTLGIMDTDEDHATLDHNLGDLFTEINHLEGRDFYDPRAKKTYRLRMFLSGDWKFLKIVTGLAAPNAKHHFCLWCKCLKEQSSDTDMTWDIVRSEQERQSVLSNSVPPMVVAPVDVHLPPIGPARWTFVNQLVQQCNLAVVLKPLAKDYHLDFPGDKKKGVLNQIVAMMKGWEAQGQQGDDAAKDNAHRRILVMCKHPKHPAGCLRNLQTTGRHVDTLRLREEESAAEHYIRPDHARRAALFSACVRRAVLASGRGRVSDRNGVSRTTAG
jgi:hypothetical protein